MVDIKDILARSNTASCAVGERVILVRKENASRIIKTLRSRGFMVEITRPVGRSNMVKIYFARSML